MSVRESYAVLPALLMLLSQGAHAADNLQVAAREWTRRAAAFAGTRDLAALTVRNVSSLPAGDAGRARQLIETGLREAGVRLTEGAAVDLRATLSENPSQYLLVGEGRRGDERVVWMAAWPRARRTAAVETPAIVLEKKLLWEQEKPILDARPLDDSLLVLTPGRLSLYARQGDGWEPRQSVEVAASRPWPRDPRGVLVTSGGTLRVYLPGIACTGTWKPALDVQCRPGEEPWVLESGTQQMLLAQYAGNRNYFDGRVVAQSGTRKSVAPFYSAAAVEDAGAPVWLLAGVDGRTILYTSGLDAAGEIPQPWGSDLAGTNARCGNGQQVLATRAEDASDAVQAFRLVNRQAEAVSAPVAMPGPVTALWSVGSSAVAVVRDANSGKYAAYWLTLACGS